MIFIIGGTGFVGSAFARYCKSRGIKYSLITMENYSSFVGQSCDILINANGNAKKYFADRDELKDFDASVKSVRESVIDFKYKFYIYISSVDLYPDYSNTQSTSEDSHVSVNCQSKYGFHKYLAELCVKHVAEKWLIFRIGGLVGMGLKKNAIFDILQGGPVWLDLESELQYINTDDAARIIFDSVNKGFSNEIFNLCGDGLIKLKDVMAMVKHPVGIAKSAPRVRCEVNIEKIKRKFTIPQTEKTVKEFVWGYLKK